MADTTSTPQAPPAATRLGYQPALDGVRAIAVTLVVLFHYPWKNPFQNANPVHGGFLGVDVFFVLSGFLITTLLLQEHRGAGSVSLRQFYARRALRLLPAFAVLWFIALMLFFTLGSHDSFRPNATGLVGALLYSANWVNIYRPSALGALSHTWSLAIEEQFYVVWPAILVALLRRRLRLGAIAAIVAAGMLVTASYRAYYWHTHLQHMSFVRYYFRVTLRHVSNQGPGTFAQRLDVWNRIYFGSDTRADALLAGCLTAIAMIALLPRLGARARTRLSAASIVALVGAAVIVWRAVIPRSGWLPDWGFLALELCIAVLVAGLVAAPRAPLARLLGTGPLAWMGRRSYAIYLFHLLVFHFCNRRHIHLAPPLSLVFQLGLVLVAAELSHRLVEAPMLRRKRHFEPVVTTATP